MVINKGHTFFNYFKRIKLVSVDVFLVVNQVTGLAESRTQDGLTEFFFFSSVPRGYSRSHYNSIHGSHGVIPCGYFTNRLDLTEWEMLSKSHRDTWSQFLGPGGIKFFSHK